MDVPRDPGRDPVHIFLSITVITGFAGQISLCQGTFAAIGGFTVFQLADRYDLSVLVAALDRRG